MTQTTARRAPSRRATPTEGAAGAARRDLKVVERTSVRRVTPTAIVIAVLGAALAFGALSIQISLIHRQQQLDSLRTEINETQIANKELRQRESTLQSPAEILRIAANDLGMVESKSPELVTPTHETVGAVAAFSPATAPVSVPGVDPSIAAPVDAEDPADG